MTIETPGREEDSMRSMPGMLFTVLSMTLVTAASITSGLAPCR